VSSRGPQAASRKPVERVSFGTTAGRQDFGAPVCAKVRGEAAKGPFRRGGFKAHEGRVRLQRLSTSTPAMWEYMVVGR